MEHNPQRTKQRARRFDTHVATFRILLPPRARTVNWETPIDKANPNSKRQIPQILCSNLQQNHRDLIAMSSRPIITFS
ncbi:hypothetical protein Csa_016752 [Cucumis sativus]|uniref:Uncharacterized protein n=1 Tax=Cucumis sativus TaxID=3659 RepID=A0A0A0K6G9_CUCSA|nr:hypothetical protein Csa_016752 [Cucumis sativus]